MAKVILCPICGKKAAGSSLPFCSSRCADIDLGRWFKGEYTVPVVEDDEAPDDEIPEQEAH